jgi:hypothetical protein
MKVDCRKEGLAVTLMESGLVIIVISQSQHNTRKAITCFPESAHIEDSGVAARLYARHSPGLTRCDTQEETNDFSLLGTPLSTS